MMILLFDRRSTGRPSTQNDALKRDQMSVSLSYLIKLEKSSQMSNFMVSKLTAFNLYQGEFLE